MQTQKYIRKEVAYSQRIKVVVSFIQIPVTHNLQSLRIWEDKKLLLD